MVKLYKMELKVSGGISAVHSPTPAVTTKMRLVQSRRLNLEFVSQKQFLPQTGSQTLIYTTYTIANDSVIYILLGELSEDGQVSTSLHTCEQAGKTFEPAVHSCWWKYNVWNLLLNE